MADLVEHILREPGTSDPGQFARRVRRLSAIFALLFLGSLLGLALIVWRARLLVTLSQRSNVETLTIAFFLVFFAYLALLSSSGMRGALRLAGFRLRRLTGTPRLQLERRKHDALGPPRSERATVALNVLLERSDRPGEAFTVQVEDEAGSLGDIHVDGVQVTHRHTRRDGSSEMLALFVRQVAQRLAKRGITPAPQIVEWKKIDEESTSRYVAQTEFARALARKLGTEALWPCVQLTPEDVRELEAMFRALCPELRNEAFLPAWEYSAEHKLPVIPEPLGIVSLSRSEKRVDQAASMGCALLVVLFAVALLALVVAFPPWAPGAG